MAAALLAANLMAAEPKQLNIIFILADVLGVGANANGPSVVKLRARGANGGDGEIDWIAPGTGAAAAKSAPLTLTPGDWQDITIALAAEGPLGILRVPLPAQKQAVEIDWIEFKAACTPRRREF